MSRPVLGVNVGTHDAAAAVVAEGRVLAAGEEKRFSRAKHTKAFSEGAIRYCPDEAGLEPRDVDRVALFVDPRWRLLLPLTNLYHGFPASLGSLISDLRKFRYRNAAPTGVHSGWRSSDQQPWPSSFWANSRLASGEAHALGRGTA
ncbi:hypothetical protein ALI22I_07730 [Saccharothrix sp. ALI-22-I]|uniref:carbamoyltransferase N-terminal domain-containing protein n=1 Tax=Saccharothrix sp. ALI-22-I TaxID=1933778 RepID=UPI00097C2494|nr:carbamoyltransferase N-terminal domain-containing protein [Saccharothrix sp. ALI-22-I]ONI91747.1 hypothetical protein ALI22I_07730 [Saccharothrix sp. ALI-22-I]